METTVSELARLVGGEVEGCPETVIRGVAPVGYASESDVVLAENERYFRSALDSSAACIVVGSKLTGDCRGKSVIRVPDPGEAFAVVLGFFKPEEILPPAGIGPGAVVSRGVALGAGVAVGANCFIGEGSEIGDGCVLFPGVHIGDHVTVGAGTRMYPGVSIYSRCSIGANVILHSGVVIGADGFGYRPCTGGLSKLPHVGTVVIEENVEIGANSAVDRAKFGATTIGSGTKIDNLVHIAHNVKVGRNCVIVALSGVAGSVEIGDRVTLAAQSGVSDHVRIEDDSIVAARAGVIGDVKKASVVSGFPARNHGVEKRAQATWLRLPEMMERIRVLESELERLRAGDKG